MAMLGGFRGGVGVVGLRGGCVVKSAYKFFYDNAGYSYQPTKETKEQGRRRCASALAKAEQACKGELSFRWEVDPTMDSSDFSDESPAWSLWVVFVYNDSGQVVGSLGGVDFGRDGQPWGNPYKRVCEAELALEHMPDVLAQAVGAK